MDVILLDFEKGFDKVAHSRLLYKLDHYAVRDNTKKWIQSFLSHRTQQVIPDGVKSDTADVTSGVPQGTVLGPLLFLCFINDLPVSILSSDTKLFAADSLLFKVIENDNDRELLQRNLSALELWEETWQMRFNPTKCVVLRISNKKSPTCKTNYQLHGLYWNMHHLSGTLTSKLTSKPWSKSNDVLLDMSSMTTQQEPQDVSQGC